MATRKHVLIGNHVPAKSDWVVPVATSHAKAPEGAAERVTIQHPNASVNPRTFHVATVLRPGQGCQACLAMNPPGTWLHLRTNLGDGFTGCCDMSPNRHSTKHAKETGLPLVTSAQPTETWVYDYATETMLNP